MRVVFDTNVLIAALISRGVCAELLEHCVLHHTIFLSEEILNEFQEQLIRKLGYSQQDVIDSIELLRSKAQMVNPVELALPVCRDPDDDVILATSTAAGAACLITGDKDLLVLKQFEEVSIISPSKFSDFEDRTSN